jgi:flagellar protein FliS
MFSSAHQFGPRRGSAGSYRDVNATTAIEGASPHKLVSLLYGSVASEIAAARGAMARRDISEKARAVSHAVRVVEEGLLAPLDMQAGGSLAVNLRDLYQYLVYRLTVANLKSDDAVFAECAKLVDTLSASWDAIAEQVSMPARVAA